MGLSHKAFAYVAALAVLVYTWVTLVPAGFHTTLSNPAHFATLGGVVLALVFIGASLLPTRHEKFERQLAAQTLGAMPVFYLWGAFNSGTTQEIAIEAAGLVVFGAITLYGYFRSPLLLGVGIVAHGLLWDSWHHGHSTIIEGWYPLACLLFDVAAGIVVILRFQGSGRREGMAAGRTPS